MHRVSAQSACQSFGSCAVQVTLLEARNLPVWGFPWQSNPYCRIEVGSQSFRSRKEDATSHAGSHRAPVWNQEFQFLVEDPSTQVDFSIWKVVLAMHETSK